MGYVRLGLARFSTITRELRVVERNRLQIRDPEKILHIIDVSYAQNKVDFFRKIAPSAETMVTMYKT